MSYAKMKAKRPEMKPCDRCLENSWKYTFIEGVITATCQHCAHEISWQKKKAKFTPEGPDQIRRRERLMQTVNLHHLYVPGQDPVDREGKLPWDD